MNGLRDIWVYLNAGPLLHLTATLVAYQLGLALFRRANRTPLLNPVLTAVLLLVGLLWATGTTYDSYFKGAQFVHFLLGPATVALAVPLYRHIHIVRRSAVGLCVSIVAGSLTAAVSALSIGWLLGASRETLASLAPKSVTTPVAMGIAEKLGGLPSLTAALVIVTGILGAIMGTSILNALGIKDWVARGVAMGTASHGIGTARSLQVNEAAGAFAGLAMGFNALASALLLPALWSLFMR